jgi:hypothetical protein
LVSREPLRIRGTPERVFVSVDTSTGKSTVSFMPAGVGAPVQYEDDKTGAVAIQEARTLAARFPGCTVHGPHVHGAATGRSRPRRRG